MEDRKTNALPFQTTMGFAAIPTAVCKYYVRHPKFTPAVERIYRYLLQRHNADYGYAWPSWSVIMRETNIGSKQTVQHALDALEYLELIKRNKHDNEGGFANNYYVFLAPIEDEDEFMRRFGAELGHKRKKSAQKKAEDNDLESWL